MSRRVCMVVHAPYPVGETRVEREALAALDAGYEVDVVAMRQPGESARDRLDGVDVHRLPFLRRGRSGAGSLVFEYAGFTLLAAAKVAALHRRRRYGVVHVHNPPDFLVAAGLLPRLTGARLVFDVHDFAPELFQLRFAGRPGSRAIGRALDGVEWAALRLSDAVVTVHEPYRRALHERGIGDGRIVVALNTLDERLIPAAVERPVPSPDRAFRIVYHGTLTWHYGVDLLVEAFARIAAEIPQARLELYGSGDEVEPLRAQVARLGLGDRVHVEGRFVPQAEVLALVASADVGVVYNRPVERNRAAVPTKLFEYVALGVPVVTADLPAIHEYFAAGEVEYVRADDAPALAAALLALARDPARGEALAAAASARFEDYRWARYAGRYVELLDRLTAREPGTRT